MRFIKLTAPGALWLSALGLAADAGANTSNGYNLPTGVTDLARDMYGLHMEVFWICVGIAVVVFGAMIYSLVKFRHSKGAIADTTMLHSTKVEIIWTIIPVVILVVMAIPAAELILKQEDTRDSQLSIRVTGYQWKWEYQYMDAAQGIDIFSTLARDSNFAREKQSGIDPNTVPNYLLSVDNPLVIPSGTKVRLLLTSQDVIHAWWVPDFGAKRSAIPGFVNELWFRVDPGKEGIYRGQCAALCGRDHGFMPIVVDVRTPDDFKKWVSEQQAAIKQAAAGAAGAAPGAPPVPVQAPPTAQALAN
jgi:cytochrome c oxidase subunit 2